jgi:hypothetical protein
MPLTRYYHGGSQVYSELRPGNGVDGVGIYLTDNMKRAFMYGSRDKEGREREAFITTVGVDLDKAKLWFSDDTRYDLRTFPESAPWIDRHIAEYGEKAAFLPGGTARIYLFGNDDTSNEQMRQRYGIQAIKTHSDLIVIDSSILVYLKD